MSLINWKKGEMFPSFNAMVENFFGDSDDFFPKWWKNGKTIPAVNVSETDTDYKMEVAVPGMKKEDFVVEVHEGLMTIRAEAKGEKEEKKDHYTRKEFSYSAFERSFLLPENVNTNDIAATYQDGILHISLTKKVVSKPEEKVRKIAIG